MEEIIPTVPTTKTDMEELEDLILDNNLDRLEGLTSSFNIFESIGAVRREVRHSDFLSFLLNPNENHGLYDNFLKSFLFGVTKSNREFCSMTPIDIDLLDFSDFEVRREWESIDIIIVSIKEKFVCVIENKIDTSEHSNQLTRYESQIKSTYGDYRQIFIYLTIEGDKPDDNENWITYSYQDIYKIIDAMLVESKNKIGTDVHLLLKHYTEMINRHLMSENEIVELSKKIYQRHKRALDIIFEHRPDSLNETNACIIELLEHYMVSRDMELDHCSKSYIRFAVKRWDNIDEQLSGDGQWTKSNRVLLFEIVNNPNEIALKFLIGPGEKKFREKLFNATERNSKLFKGRSKSLYIKWTQIYKKTLVSKKQMEYELEAVKNLIQQELENFFYHGELEKLSTYIDDVLNSSENK